MKTKLINAVLWISFVLAMAASIQHLAWTFGTVERPGQEWLGWVPAIAVDAGLAALAYTIQQRRKAKRGVAVLWGGVAGFAFVSALANLYHALAVEQVALAEGVIVWSKAIVLSATLPVAYIFLGEIISGDDAAAAERSEKQAEREQTRADREARRAELEAERAVTEAKRLLAEAERQPAAAEVKPEPAEVKQLLVCSCGYEANSQAALNAHQRIHKAELISR